MRRLPALASALIGLMAAPCLAAAGGSFPNTQSQPGYATEWHQNPVTQRENGEAYFSAILNSDEYGNSQYQFPGGETFSFRQDRPLPRAQIVAWCLAGDDDVNLSYWPPVPRPSDSSGLAFQLASGDWEPFGQLQEPRRSEMAGSFDISHMLPRLEEAQEFLVKSDANPVTFDLRGTRETVQALQDDCATALDPFVPDLEWTAPARTDRNDGGEAFASRLDSTGSILLLGATVQPQEPIAALRLECAKGAGRVDLTIEDNWLRIPEDSNDLEIRVDDGLWHRPPELQIGEWPATEYDFSPLIPLIASADNLSVRHRGETIDFRVAGAATVLAEMERVCSIDPQP